MQDIRIGSKVKLSVDDYYLHGKIGTVYDLPKIGTGVQVMVDGVKVVVAEHQLEVIEE